MPPNVSDWWEGGGGHARGFLDAALVQWFELVVTVGFTQVLCVVGVGSNLLNFVVFWRQGFAESVNVSLCALAFSDLCGLLTLQVANVCAYPWLDREWGVPVVPRELMYLAGGWPHLCFARISSWIMAYVTLERCLCIVVPLHVKRLVTPGVTLTVVVVIHVALVGSILSEYATLYLDWVWQPASNASLLRLVSRPTRAGVEGVAHLVSFLTQFLAFVAVVVFTLVLLVKLRETREKRDKMTRGRAATREGNRRDKAGDNSSGASAAPTASDKHVSVPQADNSGHGSGGGGGGGGGGGSGGKRERKTEKMVVLLSCVFIACFTPSTVAFLFVMLYHEFSVYGRYRNTWLLVWSGCFALEALNANVNLPLYYHMSSRFQNTLRKMFPRLLARSTPPEKQMFKIN
ncbi:uncharacterized protein LOC101858550 [Aplysia californica]|uniref:Uncharacterized protein LOC101858550 n=1 Tax=Aplysia californica TaxID=6500 RepID=A0ABM0JKQ7_APLCA|nr:uncharacterized protein LOC101858550 [Aplysia californica]